LIHSFKIYLNGKTAPGGRFKPTFKLHARKLVSSSRMLVLDASPINSPLGRLGIPAKPAAKSFFHGKVY
jgi:hypothetical protein